MNAEIKNTKGKVVTVRIETGTVGRYFATVGVVSLRGREIHRTDLFGYGNRGSAELAALAWCRARMAGAGGAY